MSVCVGSCVAETVLRRQSQMMHCCGCCCLVAQSCLTPCDPVDCSPPGSSGHGILQARTLEWVAILLFRGSSRPRDQTWVSCINRQILYSLSHQGSPLLLIFFLQYSMWIPFPPLSPDWYTQQMVPSEPGQDPQSP